MNPTVRIICDQRETRNPILPLLEKLGTELSIQTIPVADYVVSDSCGFEYKTSEDFLSSIIGEQKGKLFRQVGDLVKTYPKPALLIGGTVSDLFVRNIHHNSVWAFLQAIIWQGCPIRFLNTPEIAANYIFEVAKKEQIGGKTVFQAHGSKTKRLPRETSEYIISSIPDIGGALAKALLEKFGSVEAVITAPGERMAEIDGIGIETAEHIRSIVTHPYFRGRE